MQDLIPEFIEEALTGLSQLDQDLVMLEAAPHNTALLDNAFRVMHTIKGTCGFIGLPRLEKMAHSAENLMDKFRNGTLKVNERAMTVLFMSVDRVRYIVTEAQSTLKEPDGNDNDLMALIEQELAGVSSDAQPATTGAAPDVESIIDKPALASAAASAETSKAPEFVRLNARVVEDLVNQASEMVLTRNQLVQLMPRDLEGPLKHAFSRMCRLVSALQDSVMQTRMQAISDVTSKFPRLVRDLSSELKKKMTIEILGDDTEMDRQLLEIVKDPLTHMLRNACDHGIESPSEREAAGKGEVGKIILRARHEGGFVVITLTDDGRGLDPEKIGAKAVEKGIVTAEALANMARKEVLRLILAPGFSTAEAVTSVSGRGVGMDVVRANIEKIGGMFEMESVVGSGTSFTVYIPLTLAIIPALIVQIDGARYALPQLGVQEVLALDHTSAHRVELVHSAPVLRLRNRLIPLVTSQMLFGTEQNNEAQYDECVVAIIHAGSRQFGLILDQIVGTQEVVIKPLSPILRNTLIFSGNAILGDGQAVLIMDPAAISRRFRIDKDLHDTVPQELEQEMTLEKGRLLLFRAADEAVPKALPLEMVSRVQVFAPEEISQSGDMLLGIYNQQVIPLVQIDEKTPTPYEPGAEVTAIILSDDMSDSAMGVLIHEVVGVVTASLDLSTATARPGVLGSVLHEDDQLIDILDMMHYLKAQNIDWFSQKKHQNANFSPEMSAAEKQEAESKPRSVRKPIPAANARVLLVDDSNFFRNMLRPILCSAGFDVTLSESAVQAVSRHDNGEMYDIIFSDIEMPGMTGYEFVERMRRDSAWRDLPFIAISSHNTPEDVLYGKQQGFDDHIGKFNKAELIRAIDAMRKGEAS